MCVSPDVVIALMNLDDRTPEFFVDEMWSKGDPRTIHLAQGILSTLGELTSAVKILRLQLSYSAGGD